MQCITCLEIQWEKNFRGSALAILLRADGPKVTEPNLLVSCSFVKISVNKFSAKSPPSKCLNFQEKGESAKTCGFLRKSAFWALSLSLSLCHLRCVTLSAPGRTLIVTLPAAPENLWESNKKWRRFLVIFCGLCFPGNRARKVLKQFGKIQSIFRSKILEGPTRKPRHTSVLARTPTRKRFPHSTVYECLKAFFDTHALFQNAPTRCLPMLKEASDIFSTR